MRTIPHRAGPGAWRAVHRAVWTVGVAVTYAIGLAAAALSQGMEALIGLYLGGGLVGASCALSVLVTANRRPTLRQVLRAGSVTGVVVLVLLGLSIALGGLGVVLLIAVHLTSPAMLGHLRHPSGLSPRSILARISDGQEDLFLTEPSSPRRPEPVHPAAPTPVRVEDAPPLDVPDHVADEDLGLAWQSSIAALRQCRTAEERLRVVIARQACLDELERRDPRAVHEWLAAKPRAAGSPTKYFSH